MPPKPDTFSEFVRREIYSVTDKLRELKSFISKKIRTDFITVFSRVRSRSEIVATFLAVLELVSDKKIRVTGGEDRNYEIEAVNEQTAG